MADNPNKPGINERNKVSNQSWELDYMKDKFNVSGQQVAGAKRAVGNDRKKIEEYLRNLGNNK